MSKSKEINLKDIKRILIVNPFGIGDVLFTTPLIKSLRNLYPNNYIGYLCNRRTSYILENNPLVDEIFVFEKDEYRYLWKNSKIKFFKSFSNFLTLLKKRQFDLCFDFSLSSHYGFFLKMIKIPVRVGYNFKNRGRFLTEKINIEGYHSRHVIEYYLTLGEFVGIKPEVPSMEFRINENDLQWAEFFQEKYIGENEKFICICPAGGESWGGDSIFKHWSQEKYAELATRIISELKLKVVFLSSPKERRIVSRVKTFLEPSRDIIDFAGKTTLGQMAGCIRKSSLVISNDGGPIHIAKALKIPTVSIFGPVDEKVYGPYPLSSEDKVITENVSCRPCYRNFKFSPCPYDKRCLKAIKVEKVFNAVKEILSLVRSC